MTHPLPFARTLLIHALAAALLCPVLYSKPKTSPSREQSKPAAASPKAKGAAANASSGPGHSRNRTASKAAAAKPARPAAPLIRQKQGDAVSDPSQAHRSLIVPPEVLLARVPASGLLNEEHCILLAIANNIELGRRRAEIRNAVAERQAIKDWRNPELRLSYGSQTDDFVRHPYIENNYEDLTGNGFPASGLPSFYQRIESHVTPGPYGEEVTNHIYNAQPDIDGNPVETHAGTTYEREISTFRSQDSNDFSALLRFRTPNPWVKKSELARASAEIMLTEAQYLAEEDQLVRDVRALFHDLAVHESTLGAHRRRRANFAAFRTEMENMDVADFAVEAARANFDMVDVLRDTRRVSTDADRTRFELARRCGIGDPRRIYSPGITTRRIIDPQTHLDEAYLIEMAMLYRADVVETRGRLGIARARMEQARAERIPWSTFFDIGYGRETRDNYSGDEDSWEIRLGIEIPLFDWTRINKRGRAYRDAAEGWEKLFNRQRDQVALEVRLAVVEVRTAYKALLAHDSDVKKERAGIAERLAKVEASGAGLKAFATSARFKYDAEDKLQLLEIERYRAYSHYNEALRTLEDTIGVRIEKVLSGSLSK